MLKGKKDGVMITKPGHLMIGNTQYGQMIHPSCCYPISLGLCLENAQGSL
jgi:hypothetical protein